MKLSAKDATSQQFTRMLLRVSPILLGIVDGRMLPSQQEQRNRQHNPFIPVKASEQQQHRDQNPRNLLVPGRRERVKDVTTIQLPDWQQIHRSGQQAYPARAHHRMQIQIVRGHVRENCLLQHGENDGSTRVERARLSRYRAALSTAPAPPKEPAAGTQIPQSARQFRYRTAPVWNRMAE